MSLADIDIRTMLLFLFAGNLMEAIIFAAYRFGAQDKSDGFDTTFLFGKLGQAGAWLLISARGTLPDPLSLVAGNILLTWGVAAECFALLSLTRVSLRRWGGVFGLLVLAVSVNCLSFLYPADISVRFALGCVMMSLFFAVPGGVFLFRPRDFSWLTWLIGISYSACAAGSMFRALILMEMSVPFELYSQSFSQVLTLSLMTMVMFIGNLGYILVKKDGLDRRLYHLATRDALTGVFNRKAFRDESLRFWSLAGREDKPLSLLMTDLDHFKDVNDNYGHPVGDQVLQRVVGVMRECLRPYDILGRYGGEEFILVLPGISPSDARSVAERIRLRVQDEFSGGDPFFGCTVSIGVAGCRPGRDELTFEDLIHFSDLALYEAKNRGRNRVIVSSDASVPDLSSQGGGGVEPSAAEVEVVD